MEQALRLPRTAIKQRESLLKRAFDRFNEASQRLEERYQALLAETQSLREQLREKDLAIKRAEKLALLGETAAALAHEVRNPLGAIKLFTSLLARDLQHMPESAKLVEQIDKSVSSLDSVVGNILQFSREQKLQLAPLNIHALLMEQKEHFQRGVAEKANFEMDLKAAPFMMGCEHSLRRALYNLILNALQATRYSGTIRIASHDGPNGEVVLEISDDGCGIPQELLGRLFDPFVTSRNEGTGLGLAVVRQTIEQHAGTIQVANKTKGACFSITLPRAISTK